MLYKDGKLEKCAFCIIDVMIFLLFKEKKTLVQTPFKLEDLELFILSPSLPTSAALKFKDTLKYGRSHSVF